MLNNSSVDDLEKQRAEAQEEVDDLINALRRERDLGDEEIIFLKAQLRGFTVTKFEAEDKAENLDKVCFLISSLFSVVIFQCCLKTKG